MRLGREWGIGRTGDPREGARGKEPGLWKGRGERGGA